MTRDNRAKSLGLDADGSLLVEIEAPAGMEGTLRSGLHPAIAAYHPAAGKFAYTEIIPRLERLGFSAAYAGGIVQAHK